MTERFSLPPLEMPERPRYAAAVMEDLLTGSRLLRRAFLQTPIRFAGRDAPLIRADDPDPPVILIRSGFGSAPADWRMGAAPSCIF
jgi:hypothetical protein